MGNIFSWFVRHLLVHDHPPPPILQLPVEILLEITAYLEPHPVSLGSLTLTCRAFYRLLQHCLHERHDEITQGLLALLEKDLGHKYYHCTGCRKLHTFDPYLTDGLTAWQYHPPATKSRNCCRDLRGFSPNYGSAQILDRVIARLVTNRHLYGAPNGLRLTVLRTPGWAWSWEGGPLWLQSSDGRIVDGELILRTKHELQGRGHSVREAINEGRYRLCHHVMTDPLDLVYPRRNSLQHVPELADIDVLKTCENGSGSCNVCLMDYTITIRQAEAREPMYSTTAPGAVYYRVVPNGWQVTMVSYHLLGECRDEDDWKWKASVGSGKYSDPICKGNERDLDAFPPGQVKRMWDSLNQATL
ncbi:uncharacterized protein F5Z01DRAFT_222491 [Emericellopsis atlantica]|uniref:F-box domain-containing protein n=1 Tax=Emericellopsis atlantica TaxID=2614577 RepID=A0A9P8CPE2_9HYPO|nr:uncharacterized protein F5Z01DRAFT_222491 [Emericellopsis atlantica]KAG9252676.1 hypothetical protein F5Z01DRAFT_222491 [Emericellopsis atlantica]